MIEKQDNGWKKDLQIIFPELLFLSYNNNTTQIVIANINNISCRDFIRSSKEKMFRFAADELRTVIQNMMQAAPSPPGHQNQKIYLHQTASHQSLWQAF